DLLGIYLIARRAADVLPGHATVAAADHAALLDADQDLVGNPRVERDPAGVGRVGRHRETPSLVVRDVAEAGQLAERAAAVRADVHHGRHRAHVDLIGPRRMHGHGPDLAVVDAARGEPFPGLPGVVVAVP